MIKWFDVNEFLPGKESKQILIRFDLAGMIVYRVGFYNDGIWECDPKVDRNKVTHWAFIEEPI